MSYASELRFLKQTARRWQQGASLREAADLLECSAAALQLHALPPDYDTFRLPKGDGSYRTIEAPAGELKALLRKLNRYLQASYYFCKPPSAYGYVTCPADDPDPRHIAANAARHLGSAYLLNADLEDFFHYVTTRRATE